MHGTDTELTMRRSLVLLFILSQIIACSESGSQTNKPSSVTSPSLRFTANQTLINSGESVDLNWDASNVDSCMASGDWSGPKILTGSESSPQLTIESTLILNCDGVNGSISKSVNVSILPAVTSPSLSFTANTTLINSGQSVSLSWDASNVDTCMASGDWSGPKPLNGPELSSPLSVDSSFILNCGGSNGSSSETVNVSINTFPHDMTRANSYDDAWESAWIANVASILTTPVSGISKTSGKVLQVGDSMTFSFAYGLWARSGTGGTTSDLDTITWMFGDANLNNGWDLSSGGVTAQNNMGWGNGKIDQIFVDPLTNDAQFAILMMNVPTSSDPTDLTIVEQRIDEFSAVGIVPVLSTIPPRTDPVFETTLAEPYNAALRALAQQLSLPLIDYSKEILLRRPNGTWENTLISSDGVHPSGGGNGFTPESNPYTPGGDPTTNTTGEATLNSGYLLRTWLTIQKMKEMKQKVVD
jgi:hypothetical protein